MTKGPGKHKASRPAELEETASRILVESLGVPFGHIERLTMGVMTHKFVARASGGATYLVRFYPPSRAGVVQYEPDLLRRCRAAGARVPQVVTDSRSGPRSELAYVVYEFVAGRPLSQVASQLSTESWDRLSGQLMEQLGRLRRIEFEGFGEPITATRAHEKSWEAFVKSSFKVGLHAVRSHSLLPPSWLKHFDRIVGLFAELPLDASPFLIWGDIQFDNILVNDDNQLAALIDFEGALSGDDVATLGYLFAKYGDSSPYRAFSKAWSASEGAVDQRRVCLYAILRVLRIAPYAHRPLPNGRPHQPLIEVFQGLENAVSELANSDLQP